jgi:hypothetical protein
MAGTYELVDNYMYLFHTDEWVLLPQYPDSISDSMGSNFAQENVLSRTAPIFSYINSGPRTVQVDLDLHRDMLKEMNLDGASNMKIEVGDDYIETIVKRIQAIAVPKFSALSKTITPPMIAIKFGRDVFIKGVVISNVAIEYQKPIMTDGRYARVTLHFTVYETTPFDAESISQLGSFRGVTKQFKNGIYKDD